MQKNKFHPGDQGTLYICYICLWWNFMPLHWV